MRTVWQRWFQSTPPHGGRHTRRYSRAWTMKFQSTPPHGGRPGEEICQFASLGFNPRPRMGGDVHIRIDQRALCRVSIHAPAWGATTDTVRGAKPWEFQSTPPHGGRRAFQLALPGHTRFQSTPPHGGRLSMFLLKFIPTAFQSTPPHGGRQNLDQQVSSLFQVSIHAPAWGATYEALCQKKRLASFNPRPRMGGDSKMGVSGTTTTGFNPRPRMGGDKNMIMEHEGVLLFQSTPPHGGRLASERFLASPTCFNPRPRMGGDIYE